MFLGTSVFIFLDDDVDQSFHFLFSSPSSLFVFFFFLTHDLFRSLVNPEKHFKMHKIKCMALEWKTNYVKIQLQNT